jgi:hypothetical protein
MCRSQKLQDVLFISMVLMEGQSDEAEVLVIDGWLWNLTGMGLSSENMEKLGPVAAAGPETCGY